MFTGIITDVGQVMAVSELPKGRRYRIKTVYDVSTIDIGASIAHSGVCLTVVGKGEDWYEVEAWEEALRLSTLGSWQAGTKVNLERSLKMGDELGGHLVSGHVDGIAKILSRTDEGDAVRFLLELPETLARFVAPKGSIALDGTSLTVNGVDGNRFDVLLIKHSQDVTTWGDRAAGDEINVEIDQMARYVARLAEYS